MTKQLEALIARLNERYGPTEVPKCRICSGNLSLQRSGAGVDVWACSGQINDGDGWHYAPGRDIADTHYQESRWHDYSGGGDADVIELIAALEQAQQQKAKDFEIKARLCNESNSLHDRLKVAEKRIAELEASETQLIEDRDNAEEALADMYQAATGERPEWSNWFSFADAVDAVEQRLGELEASPLAVKLPDRKDIRFWPGDAFEFDTLGYVMAVKEAIRAAGGRVEGE